MRTIKISFKCSCMQDEGSFEMRERRDGEDVVGYVEQVQVVVTIVHRRRSPTCTATELEYLKLPIGEGTVGRAEGGTA